MPTELDDATRATLAGLDQALKASGSPLRRRYEQLVAAEDPGA